HEIRICSHIFFTCPKVERLWKLYYNWLSVSTVCPSNAISHLWQHGHFVGNKEAKERWYVVWCATLWCIWRKRNECICNEGSFVESEVTEKEEFMAWTWM
ncbi:hypothetical protein glysoja_012835, partial [Glycine soja]